MECVTIVWTSCVDVLPGRDKRIIGHILFAQGEELRLGSSL
jgi:hypothetical protein